MNQLIGLLTFGHAPTWERSSSGLWRLRLALGWTILCAALVELFALSWDIQWHAAVGRDHTLTMPHLFILGSILVMGLGALAAVLIETVWARRSPPIAQSGTRFASFFSSSLGAYLVGYGALDSAIAFPLDQYWHTLYGVDVAIWAPFHIMAITGVCVSCLGVTEMLASGASLATHQGARSAARAGYVGVMIALAILMGLFSVLLPDALGPGFIRLGGLVFTVFPFLFGAFGMFVFAIAIRALPWGGMATSVTGVYLLFGLLNFLFIPPVMTWLLGIEQQSLRPRAPTVSVLAIEWQYGLIIAAVLLDIAIWIAQRRGRPLKRANRITLVAGWIGMSLAALFFPAFLSTAQAYATYGVRGSRLQAAAIAQPHTSVVLIVAVSLLLGVLGTSIGNWLGAGIGESMQRKEQTER